jgi:hypothetical protein
MVHTLDHPPLSCNISPNFSSMADRLFQLKHIAQSSFQPTDILLHTITTAAK